MAANELSLHLTSAYRERLFGIRQTVEVQAGMFWRTIDPKDFDGSYPILALVAATTAGQARAVSATTAYLTAYLTSELGEPAQAPTGDPAQHVGVAADGRQLDEMLRSPLIGTKAALKQHKPLARALEIGRNRLVRMVGMEIDEAGQRPLLAGIDQDKRFGGWQRAVRGTCGACLGAATGPGHGLRFPRHPHCQCVAEPIVRGVSNRFPRPTGADLFAAMTAAQQDDALGPLAAELVRAGDVTLAQLVDTSPRQQGENFITQKPAKEVAP